MDAEQRAEEIIEGADADVAEVGEIAEELRRHGPVAPDRADADRGRASGALRRLGARQISSPLAGCCATTSSSATRGGCSAGFAPRERTARSCASRTRSAPTRTWSCPRRAARPRARDPHRGRLARGQHQRRDARDRGRDLQAQVGGDAKRADLESAAVVLPARLRAARRSESRLRRASTPPSSATSWRSSRSATPGISGEAARAARARRRDPAPDRRERARRSRVAGATRPSARRSSASGDSRRPPSTSPASGRPRRDSCGGWRRRRCSSARSPACAASTAGRCEPALEALVGDRPGRGPPRRHRQGRPSALRRRLPRLAVSHRHPRPARGVQGAAPGRGAFVRLRRLDPRRVLLPQAAPAAGVEGRRRDRGRRLRAPSCASSPRSSSHAVRGDLRGRLFGERDRQLEDALARATRAPTAPPRCSSACSLPGSRTMAPARRRRAGG